jgi:hypothetical protein
MLPYSIIHTLLIPYSILLGLVILLAPPIRAISQGEWPTSFRKVSKIRQPCQLSVAILVYYQVSFREALDHI